MAKFTADDIANYTTKTKAFTAYDILAAKRDRETSQKQRDSSSEQVSTQKDTTVSNQKTQPLVSKNILSNTGLQAVTTPSVSVANTQNVANKLTPFTTSNLSNAIKNTNTALNTKKTENELINKWADPSYKLSDAEKEQAKAFLKTPEIFFKRLGSTDKEELQKLANIEAKTSKTLSALGGFFGGLGIIGDAVQKVGELGNKNATNIDEQLQSSTTQNPITATAGGVAGTLAEYAVGSKVAQGIKPIASATQKAGQALSKLPILSKVGAQPIANVLGDMTLDVALDTVPSTVKNIQQGKSSGEVATETAKNLGINLAFNVAGETLGTLLSRLAKNKSGTEIQNLLVNASNKATKEELPTVVASEVKKALNEPLNALQSTSKTIQPTLKTETPITKYVEPVSVKLEKANVSENASKISQDIVENVASNKRLFKNSTKRQLFNETINGIDDITAKYNKAISENDFVTAKKSAQDLIEKAKDIDSTLSGSYIESQIDDELTSGIKKAIKQNLSGKSILLNKSTADYIKRSTGLTIPEFSAKYGRPNNIFLTTNVTNARAISLDNSQDILESLSNAGVKIDMSNPQDLNLDVVKSIIDNTGKSEKISQKLQYDSDAMWENVLKNSKQMYDDANKLEKMMSKSNIQKKSLEPLAKTTTEKPITMAENTGLVSDLTKKGKIVDEVTMKERGYAESIREKTDLPEEVKQEFIDNPEVYTVLSNESTKTKAEDIFKNNTLANSESIYDKLLKENDASAIPLGYNIAKAYSDNGEIDKSVDVLRKMSQELTKRGQFTQAAAIYMMRSEPMSAMRYVEKEIDSINNAGKKKFGDKWNGFSLNDEEKKAFSEIQPGDTDAIKGIYEKIYNRLNKEYPSTTWEKIVELSKISMLLNPRTMIKNVASNALLLPINSLSNKVSAVGQNAIAKIVKDFKPNQAVTVSSESKKLSFDAWKKVEESILGSSDTKWNDVKGAMREKQIFKGTKASQFLDTVTNGAITKANKAMGKDISPSVLETTRNFTYDLLKKGDDTFVKKNFENRLASFIEARGIKNVDDIPEEAYTIATLEALRATFKDENKLTQLFSNIKSNTGKFGEILLPFTKTPANLAVRSYEYSPASIVKIFDRAQRKDLNKLMDDLGKTFVGTAGVGLGAYLYNKGIVTGDYSEDPDEAAFQKQQGFLPFAIKAGDNYISYDWAQPSASSLLIGTAIAQGIDNESNVLDNLGGAFTAAGDQWLSLSPLQNVADIFGGYGTPTENVANTVLESPQRLIPSALGATTRATDPVQRSTYSKDDILGTQVNAIKSKIPVLSKTLPANYDTWGREIKRSDTTAGAIFSQFINPGTTGNANITPIDSEISKLYKETGNNAVFPLKAERTIKVDGENKALNNKEYSEYQKSMGEKSYEMASYFINSDTYKNMDSTQSAKILQEIYSFSKALAKEDITGSVSADEKPYNIYKEKGLDAVVDYIALSKTTGKMTNADTFKTVDSSDMTKAEKGYYLDMLTSSSKAKDSTKAKYGDSGIYDLYDIQSKADKDSNNSVSGKELVNYLSTTDMDRQKRKFYYEILVSAKNNPYK